MATVRVKDLDDRRADLESNLLVWAGMGGVCAGAFLYVRVDAYWVSRRFPDLGFLLLTLGLTAACLYCLIARRRMRRRGRILEFDPGTRDYRVGTGPSLETVEWSGAFDDVACVRLATKVRRIYQVKHALWGDFWTISLAWKDKDRRPFCVQEFGGWPVSSRPIGSRADLRGVHHQAQAALARWGADFGVPTIDATLAPDDDGVGSTRPQGQAASD